MLGKSLALQKFHFSQATQLLQPGKEENHSWAAPWGKVCRVPFARKGMDYSHLSQPKNSVSIINRAEKAMSDSTPNSSWGQAATTLCEPRLVPWPEAAVCTGTGRTATSATAPLHHQPAFKCTHPASKIQSSEDEGYLYSRACFKLMGLYSREKGDNPKPASQRQEASFCDWKAVAEQHILEGGYMQSKNFLPFLSCFSCDGIVGFPAAL